MDAKRLIEILNLEPHPAEGGYYRETYRSGDAIPQGALPSRYAGRSRSVSTAIYFLLTRDTFSAMHRLRGDEIFHFYMGDPVTMVHLYPDGHGEEVILGNDLERGHKCQVVVPMNVWQGAFLDDGGEFALLGTTVAPGFDFADFELGRREDLVRAYPEYAGLTERLTRG
ncbi:MAG: cupin domain-containing protein [Candidatus Coatesbacteria bacterium]|nr:cupin domain-containing protein [Candidatus Coatesbacteria bacterium]